MNRRTGFTLIELLITITILGALIVLSVVSLRSLQANARDEERKTDVENIARGLELRYVNGNPKVTTPSYVQKGTYPGVNEMLHAMGWDRSDFAPTQIVGGYLTDLLPDTTPSDFVAPVSGGTFGIICLWACQPAETASVVDAETTLSKYIYEPIDASGNICSNGNCVRYNLYYRTEKDNVIHKITSKRQ
jgi:prepilin-type N-terminal cleavage/methylation domain-containing protein